MGESYDGPLVVGKREGGLGLCLVLLLCLSGCGYSLNNRLKEGFENPRGIYVPVFVNSTSEVGAERVFTDAFIREMQSRGVRITDRQPGAYEIKGSVNSINYSPTNLTPT